MTTALAYQTVIGQKNTEGTAGKAVSTTGDAFIIGNGSSSATSNAFRVTYAGAVYGQAAYNTSGADYAEYFEWLDKNPNNEDRVGLFVTIYDGKIRIAQPNEYILGVVSANPCVIGNSDMEWNGKFLKDKFQSKFSKVILVVLLFVLLSILVFYAKWVWKVC